MTNEQVINPNVVTEPFGDRFSAAVKRDFGSDLSAMDGKIGYQWLQDNGLLQDFVTQCKGDLSLLSNLLIVPYEPGITSFTRLESDDPLLTGGPPAVSENAKYLETWVEKYPRNMKETILTTWMEKYPRNMKETILTTLSQTHYLPPDRQEKIVEAVAYYIKTHTHDTPYALEVWFIRSSVRRVVREGFFQPKEEDTPLIGLQKKLSEFRGVEKIAEVDRPDFSPSSGRILSETIESELIIPSLISAVYKPASIFWNRYFETVKDGTSPEHVAEKLDLFITAFVRKSLLHVLIDESDSPKGKYDTKYERYIVKRILPAIRSHFRKSALFKSELQFMKDRDLQGKRKYPFLHQVEGARQLIEAEGGILADDPGIGKTLILALAALNINEKRALTGASTGRTLVVANKSVVNVWQQELREHIVPDSCEVINLNTPPDPKKQGTTLDEKTALRTRLHSLKVALDGKGDRQQIVLVNYDVFRDKFFQQMIKELGFDTIVVDEAHHVRGKNVAILTAISKEEQLKTAAERTQQLYRFILENPEMRVLLATATPYVKKNIEPLILAHLVNRNLVAVQDIRFISKSDVRTNTLLRQVITRRRKEEVADLPEKTTRFIPLKLSDLPEDEQQALIETANKLGETVEDNVFARFFALHALETQVKMSWLKRTVAKLQGTGKKVVIFTPFVQEYGRLTSTMSTAHIAHFLREEGIEGVGILDGSLSLEDRQRNEKEFKVPISTETPGLNVLVGNYETAGESITLCSPENNATESILFVCPNMVSKMVQAVDRIHRFGQTGNVTIYVPFVTGDILDREGGTYDERIVKRLYGELAQFGRVVDGLFFVEPANIYEEIAREKDYPPSFAFKPTELLNRIAKSREQIRQNPSKVSKWEQKRAEDEKREAQYLPADSGVVFEGTVDPKIQWQLEQLIITQDPELRDLTRQFFDEIGQYRLLTGEQEQILAQKIEAGLRSTKTMKMLEERGQLSEAIQGQLGERVRQGAIAREAFINSNMRLVITIAKKYLWSEIPLIDLIQEGSFGLMRAVEDFDWSLGYKFSTKAYWWIKQSIDRAVKNTSHAIRIPVHVLDVLPKAFKLQREFEEIHNRRPSYEELQTLLEENGFVHVEEVMWSIKNNFFNIQSLDEPINSHRFKYGIEGDSFGDLIVDPEALTEQQAADKIAQEILVKEVNDIIGRMFTPREMLIIERRLMEERESRATLEELAKEFSVTRERIRQIEDNIKRKARESRELRGIYNREIMGGNDIVDIPFGQNPENVVTRSSRTYGSMEGDMLTETIFKMPKKLANIMYRRLYSSLTNAQVAYEMELAEEDTNEYYIRARISLWQKLFRDGVDKSPMRRRLLFFPDLDPRSMAARYEAHGNKLPSNSRKIVELFFGINRQRGFYDINRVARKLSMKPTYVKYYLREAIKQLESGQTDR